MADNNRISDAVVTEEPAPAPPTDREEGRKRAEDCNAELQKLLARYRCRIVPVMAPDQVGAGPLTRMLVTTTYWVLPNLET